jgi:hypothetical protein
LQKLRPRILDTDAGGENSRNSANCHMAGELQLIASMSSPPLRLLHAVSALSAAKLQQYRRMSTSDLVDSLNPGTAGALKTRPDGTVLEGHHRLAVLNERGIDIHALPREVIPRDT